MTSRSTHYLNEVSNFLIPLKKRIPRGSVRHVLFLVLLFDWSSFTVESCINAWFLVVLVSSIMPFRIFIGTLLNPVAFARLLAALFPRFDRLSFPFVSIGRTDPHRTIRETVWRR